MAVKKKNTKKITVKPIAVKVEPVDTSFKEQKEIIKDEKVELNNELKKIKKTSSFGKNLVFTFLAITLILGIAYLVDTIIMTKTDVAYYSNIITATMITLFTILFVIVGIYASNKKGKVFVIFASILLSLFCSLQILDIHNLITLPEQKHVINLTNKSLAEAIEWASRNNVTLEQKYEYSDDVKEYYIIYQNVDNGTLLNKVEKLSVTVSNGPDKNKEVMFPSMLGKNVDDVVKFVEDNYFSNVTIDFEYNTVSRDTVIEQDKTGALARDEAIHIIVSLGDPDEIGESEMIDLTDKSLFFTETWLKRNLLKYEFTYEYSDTIEKNHVISQDVAKGTTMAVDSLVKIVISKGPKIIVPNLNNMTASEITDWIIKNKLKVTFTDSYNSDVEIGKVISASVKENDEIEQNTMITIDISKGPLKLEKYNNLNELRDWATKYGVTITEKYEFNDSIAAGEIIKVSKNPGDAINKDETIEVTISDGKELTIPNVVGKTKSEASLACKSAGIACSYVYAYSNTVDSGKVIKQSKTAGSKVAQTSVLTLTISNGKKTTSSTSNNNNSSTGTTNQPVKTPAPTPVSCDRSQGAALNIGPGNNGAQTATIIKGQNPNHKFSFNYVSSCPNGNSQSGTVCTVLDGVWKNYCDTITVTIVS